MDRKIFTKKRSNMEEEMRRLLSEFSQMRHGPVLHSVNLWHPATDVCETRDKFIVLCELPGIGKEDVRIHIEDGVITISGVRREPHFDGKVVYHNLEVNYGPFERNIQYPDRFEGDSAKASFEGGMLRIILGTRAGRGSERVDIEID